MQLPPDSMSAQPPANADQAVDVTVRFVAKLIDGVVLFVLVSIITMVIRPLLPGPRGLFTPGIGLTGIGVAALVVSIVSALVYIAYLSLLESMRGQTVGKMLLKLTVVGAGGGHPTLQEAFKRNSWVLLGILPWFGGLLQAALAAYIGYTMYDSDGNVGWHDQFAGGTRVIREG